VKSNTGIHLEQHFYLGAAGGERSWLNRLQAQRGTAVFASTLAGRTRIVHGIVGIKRAIVDWSDRRLGPSTEPVPDGSTAGSIAASNVVARATVQSAAAEATERCEFDDYE